MFSEAKNWSLFLYLWENVFLPTFLLTLNTTASPTQPRREADFFFFFYRFLFVCFLLLYFPPFLLGMLQQEVQKRSCVRLCPDTPLVCWTTMCAHAWGHTCLPRSLSKRLRFPYLWPVFLAPCTAPEGLQKLKCHDTW